LAEAESEDVMLREAVEIAKAAHEASSKPEALKELKKWNSQLPLQDAEIIALGTGSSVPSRYRNVSATLVRVPGYGSYLLDAGENTLGQLQRVFPPSEMIEVLKDLRMIWISHLHADHHLGTVSIIKAWHSLVHGPKSTIPPTSPNILHSLNPNPGPTFSDQRPKYIAVVSDIAMLHYLSEYASVENYGYEHVLPLSISGEWDHSSSPARNSTILRLVHRDCPVQVISSAYYPALLGLRNIQAVPVNHCHGALAVAMTFPRKWIAPTPNDSSTSHNGDIRDVSNSKGSSIVPPFKIAFSGDCRPSARFAAIGERSTVLIHEATFEDELVGDAKAKKHSTVREALGVGSLMGAKCVILTHFSQRYQKVPVLDHFWGEPEAVTREILGEDDEQEKQAGIEPTEDDVRHVSASFDSGASTAAPINTNFDLGIELPPPTSTEIRLASPIRDISSHFQKELAKAKPMNQGDMKVIVAFDYMRVRVGDVAEMEALRPALAKLFEVDMEENEKRAAKRLANAATNGGGANAGKKGKKRKSGTASFDERAAF
jgi:ribonuclease Z